LLKCGDPQQIDYRLRSLRVLLGNAIADVAVIV